MNCFLILLFVIPAVFFSKVNSEETTPPPPVKCQAKGLTVDQDITEAETIWWVGDIVFVEKVEVTPYCFPPNFINHIDQYCGGMKVKIICKEDGSRKFITASYDTRLSLVSCLEESYNFMDDKKLIEFTGKVTKFGTIKEDKILVDDSQNILPIYTDLKNDFAVIAIAENKEWMIFETCNQKAAWVLYTDAVVQANQLDKFKPAVEEAIQNAGFDATKLVCLVTTINMDSTACIPNVNS